MSITQSLALTQTQKQALTTRIVEIPLLRIDHIIADVVRDPELVSATLSRDKSTTAQTGNSWNPAIGYLGVMKEILGAETLQDGAKAEKDTTDREMIVYGQAIEAVVGHERIAQPDITFISKSETDFSLQASENLKPAQLDLQLLQIPGNVNAFLKWLIRQKNWIVTTLFECYRVIGEQQTVFLAGLDQTDWQS